MRRSQQSDGGEFRRSIRRTSWRRLHSLQLEAGAVWHEYQAGCLPATAGVPSPADRRSWGQACHANHGSRRIGATSAASAGLRTLTGRSFGGLASSCCGFSCRRCSPHSECRSLRTFLRSGSSGTATVTTGIGTEHGRSSPLPTYRARFRLNLLDMEYGVKQESRISLHTEPPHLTLLWASVIAGLSHKTSRSR